MRWILRFFLTCLILGAFVAVGFISYVRATSLPLVIVSPLQGTRILKPGEWGIYPESLIPHYVKITPLISSVQVHGEINFPLPYNPLLKNIENYTVSLSYSAHKQLNEQESQSIIQRGISYYLSYWKSNIEGRFKEILGKLFSSSSLPKEKEAKRELLQQGRSIAGLSLYFTKYPDMNVYSQMRKEIVSTLQSRHMGEKSIAMELESQQERQQIERRKESIKMALDFSIQQAQAITDAKVDFPSTFSILQLLLPNTSNPVYPYPYTIEKQKFHKNHE